MALRVTHHITKTEKQISEILKGSFKLSKKDADALFRLGAIYYEEERVFEDRAIPPGAHLKIYLRPTRYPVNGLKWKDCLVAEEDDFIIINKPAGVPTHATVDNWYENALFQMRSFLNKDLLVTGRLDTPVNGLLLFAKNSFYQSRYNEWLAKGRVHKHYTAVTEVAIPLGLHSHYMERSAKVPKRLSDVENKNWDLCKLKVLSSTLVKETGFFTSEIELMTGRTHQIRAQLSFLGCPIVGDHLYKSKAKWLAAGIGLTSKKLAFQSFNYKL